MFFDTSSLNNAYMLTFFPIISGLITKKLAVEHYLTIGYKENRQFTGEVMSMWALLGVDE
jgi:hypothetical protein